MVEGDYKTNKIHILQVLRKVNY